MSYLSVRNLTAGYGRNPVIRNVSFGMDSGCLLGVIGANGSGKTTLLKALCGILPHEGSCMLSETPLEKLPPRQLARHVSYIPQRSGISIDIPAVDVVLMGFNPQLGLLEHPTAQMRDAARSILAQVGLYGKEDMNYLHLSEGQKQLCILARTLVSGSELLLLDEPESALDFRYRYRMLALLRNWVHAGKRGAIVTLHDPSLALNYCDKLLLLSGGGILGVIDPAKDTLDNMERLLTQVYGSISLQRCPTRSGSTQLVMLKEEQP